MDKQRMTSGKEELKRRNTEDMSLRRGQERWLPYSYFRSSADCTILLFLHWSFLESGSTEIARGLSRVFLPIWVPLPHLCVPRPITWNLEPKGN